MRQTIQTGKNEPITSIAGARPQPVNKRQTAPMPNESAGVLLVIAGPEVEWEKAELLEA
jgi:hypothetical protein